MGSKVLTPAAAMEAKRLYEMKDSRGKRIYSQLQIAEMLGVSETTVFRVVHRSAAFAGLREMPTDQEAKASLEKFLQGNPDLAPQGALEKMQAAVREVKELPGRVEGMLDELRRPMPVNPLEEQ